MFNRTKRRTADPVARLQSQLAAIGDREDGPFENGLPLRWAADPRRRCVTGHVVTEWVEGRHGTRTCPVCSSPTVLTFPEDRGGPLGHGQWAPASSAKRTPPAGPVRPAARADRLRVRHPGHGGA